MHKWASNTWLWQTQCLLCPHCVSFKGLSTNTVEWRQDGGQIAVTCSTDQQNQHGMYLYHTYSSTREVFYLTPGMKCSPRVPFEKRVKISGNFSNLTATITHLTIHDTGVFWCQYLRYIGAEQTPSKSEDQPVLLVVNSKNVCFFIFGHFNFVMR